MKKTFLLLMLVAASSCGRTALIPEDDGAIRFDTHISNGYIHSFAEDSHGFIWMATGRGLNRYDGNQYMQFLHTKDSTSIPDNKVNDVLWSLDNKLWVATDKGVAILVPDGRFTPVRMEDDNICVTGLVQMGSGSILAVATDHISACQSQEDGFRRVIELPLSFGSATVMPGSGSLLWVLTYTQLLCYDSSNYQQEAVFPTHSYVLPCCMDRNGVIWMSGGGRIDLFDTRTRQWKDAPEAISRIAGKDFFDIYETSEGNILFSSVSDGYWVWDPSQQCLLGQEDAAFPYALPRDPHVSIFTDTNNNIWTGTDGNGFRLFSPEGNPFDEDPRLSAFFNGMSILSMAESSDGAIWISTLRNGIFRYTPQNGSIREESVANMDAPCTNMLSDSQGYLWLCFPNTFEVKRCSWTGNHLHVLQTLSIPAPLGLLETSNGTVWVSDAAGTVHACRNGKVRSYQLGMEGQRNQIECLLDWDGDAILAAISDGPLLLFRPDDGKQEVLPLQGVTILHRDASGTVWAGTDHDGLFRLLPSLEAVPVAGTSDTSLSSMEEDSNGNHWISTVNGLLCLNLDGNISGAYTAEDGLGGNDFHRQVSLHSRDDMLFFGRPDGITLFRTPTTVQSHQVPVVFDNLRIHNVPVRPAADAPLKTMMPESDRIVINHRQNGFSISYAALDYAEGDRIRYSYRMEGFDPYWIDAGHSHDAYYSNLPAGKYHFTVRAESASGRITNSEGSIDVRILPDPWRSWVAILMYCIAGGLLIFIAFWEWRLRRKKHREAEEIERLNQMQMSFFANVAHEFRTPLTLIAGPMASLDASDRIAGNDRKMLSVMRRSVNWMLHLVNQLLDFNKLDGDRLELRVHKEDVVPCLLSVVEGFQPNAQAKRITLSAEGISGGFQMWMDRDKVVKILMNLLSNALKFTPEGGQVEVSMNILSRERAGKLMSLTESDTDTRYLYVSVKDTGPGIPQEELERIFERFYQLRHGKVAMGSGIGLYYSRSLAAIHHGYLKAWNRTDLDSGAIFGLLLPVSESSYSEKERSSGEADGQISAHSFISVQSGPEIQEEGKRSVMVVDDDVDIANYLKILLQPQYRVQTFFDVDSALAAMEEEAPDLILSDVMMPGRSGYDLCQAVKGNLQLCHIPLILVTAMDKVSHQVEGLEKGADAYVTKPFDPSYLMALIGSQLENRDKLRSQLGRAASVTDVDQTRMAPQDKVFMKELYKLMDEDLSNPELDVSCLTEKMKMSRSKFYYKVKGLTGENPGDFFRRYKLNKAAGLLLEGKLNISEVADHTGFSSLSYFSSCFKKHFGVPPSEYRG